MKICLVTETGHFQSLFCLPTAKQTRSRLTDISTVRTIRTSTHMLPFRLSPKPGIPIYEQAVYAATRAIVSGQMRIGDSFPSVRALSRELKINPNTAHKVIAQLLNDGLLESHPGVGTVIAKLPDSTSKERTELLTRQIEELVVEAKRLSIGIDQVLKATEKHWRSLSAKEEAIK
jgi:GntR family transcriptional regulator